MLLNIIDTSPIFLEACLCICHVNILQRYHAVSSCAVHCNMVNLIFLKQKDKMQIELSW